MIAVVHGSSPKGGTRNYRLYTRDTHSSLHEEIHLNRSFYQPSCSHPLRAESLYNLATKVEEYASIYRGRGLHSCSHGESLLPFMQGFQDTGLFSPDEPETALSPQRQLTLLMRLSTMAWEGSQFLTVTDSLILLGTPSVQILGFDGGVIGEIIYEQTASYQITEMSINNREYMLDRLLWKSKKQRVMNTKQATTIQQRGY